MTRASFRPGRCRTRGCRLHTGGVEKAENARPQLTAAVCAHVGMGADDSVARAARDRLGNALANYRRRWTAGREAELAARPVEERLLPEDESVKTG